MGNGSARRTLARILAGLKTQGGGIDAATLINSVLAPPRQDWIASGQRAHLRAKAKGRRG